MFDRSLKALYFLVIKNAKIENINTFLKEGDTTSITYPSPKKPKSLPASSKVVKFSSLLDKNSIRIRKKESQPPPTKLISPEFPTDDTESPKHKFISSSSIDSRVMEHMGGDPAIEMV